MVGPVSELEVKHDQEEAEQAEHVEKPTEHVEKPAGDAGPEEWLRFFGDECRTLRVYRKDPQGKYELLDTYAADVFTEPLVAEQYGGGAYHARLCAPAGGYLKQTIFRIAGDPRGTEPAPVARAEPLERAAHMGNSAADMMASAVLLATSMQQAQTTLLVPLLEALTNRGGGDGSNLQDMEAMFSIMERMQNVAAERSGGDDIFRSLGLPLLAQIQKLGEQEKAQGAPEAGASPDIAPPAPVAPGPSPGWVTALRPYVAELTQLAAFQGDPVYWSRTILAKVSDAEFLFLEDEAGRDGFPDEFHSWFPDTVPHRPWFARFWAEMVEAVKEARTEDGGAEQTQADAG
jgi:hypothetical protein